MLSPASFLFLARAEEPAELGELPHTKNTDAEDTGRLQAAFTLLDTFALWFAFAFWV